MKELGNPWTFAVSLEWDLLVHFISMTKCQWKINLKGKRLAASWIQQLWSLVIWLCCFWLAWRDRTLWWYMCLGQVAHSWHEEGRERETGRIHE